MQTNTRIFNTFLYVLHKYWDSWTESFFNFFAKCDSGGAPQSKGVICFPFEKL